MENLLRARMDLDKHILALRRDNRATIRWSLIALAVGSIAAFAFLNFLAR